LFLLSEFYFEATRLEYIELELDDDPFGLLELEAASID